MVAMARSRAVALDLPIRLETFPGNVSRQYSM
jgi:hypothetical protein